MFKSEAVAQFQISMKIDDGLYNHFRGGSTEIQKE